MDRWGKNYKPMGPEILEELRHAWPLFVGVKVGKLMQTTGKLPLKRMKLLISSSYSSWTSHQEIKNKEFWEQNSLTNISMITDTKSVDENVQKWYCDLSV